MAVMEPFLESLPQYLGAAAVPYTATPLQFASNRRGSYVPNIGVCCSVEEPTLAHTQSISAARGSLALIQDLMQVEAGA